MARKNRFRKIEIQPDPKFNNLLISKFTNRLMERGKRSVAQEIVYDTLEIIQKQAGKDPIEIFEAAIKRVSPVLEVKAKRVGGANYQVPFEVRGERREALACRWIIEAAHRNKGKRMAEKLATEIILSAKGEGDASKKKEDTHRMAEANKAFAHFAKY
jgi:small subunit ribosomal protein S7